jgi:tetratricopeptide (TPR) repeat protein
MKQNGKNMAQLIQEIRVICGLSQTQFGQPLGVDQSYVSLIEKGKRPIPDGFLEKLEAQILIEHFENPDLAPPQKEELLRCWHQLLDAEGEALRDQFARWGQRKEALKWLSVRPNREITSTPRPPVERFTIPDAKADFFAQIDACFVSSNLVNAVQIAEDATISFPLDPDFWIWKSISYGKAGDNGSALEAAKYALHLDENSELGWSTRILACAFTGHTDRDCICHGTLAKFDPKGGHALSNAAVAQALRGKTNRAIDLLEMAIEAEPGNEWVWLKKGVVLNQLGKSSEALHALDTALQRNPKNAWATGEKAMVLFNQGRYDGASPAFDEAIQLGEHTAYAYFCRAFIRLFCSPEVGGFNAFDEALTLFACARKRAEALQEGKIVFNFIHDHNAPLPNHTQTIVSHLQAIFSHPGDKPSEKETYIKTLIEVYRKHNVLPLLAKAVETVGLKHNAPGEDRAAQRLWRDLWRAQGEGIAEFQRVFRQRGYKA